MTDQEELAMNKDLLDRIPREDVDRVFHQEMADIDLEFLGFINTYKYLAELISIHWTVIDFGCAYAPQAYYFTDHKRYIGIDGFPDRERFCPPNGTMYGMTAGEWIEKHLQEVDVDESFAICNMVPNWYGEKAGEIVRAHFPNLYVFYPSNKTRIPLTSLLSGYKVKA